MSHAAVITHSICIDAEKQELNKINDEVTELYNNASSELFQEQCKEILESVAASLNTLESFSETRQIYENQVTARETEFQYQKHRIFKQLENLKLNLNYIDDIFAQIKQDESEINRLILKEGYIANIAIEELKETGTVITTNALQAKISQIRNKEITKQTLDKTKRHIENLIEESTLDIKIKFKLLDELDTKTSPQEISDLLAVIQELNYRNNLTQRKINTYKEALKENGYHLKGTPDVITITDDKGELRVSFAYVLNFKNNKDNRFKIIFNLDNSVQYDIGDYEKHMCVTLSEKIQQAVSKKGYLYKDIKILRNISNAKPLLKAMQQTIKSGVK
ncbi:hypothetical protein ACXYRQ_04245 [Mycoplasma sp. 394]